jgi:hypothetical protein
MLPGLVWYRTKPRQSGIFLVWYWIGIIDAGMPIPELVPSMPMPSYDCKYHNFYGARARMCVDTLHLFRKLIGRRAPFSSAAEILICATATATHFPPYSGLIFLANYFFTTALLHCPSSSYLHPLLSHNLTCSMLPAPQLQWPFASLPFVLHCVTAPTYCLTACPLSHYLSVTITHCRTALFYCLTVSIPHCLNSCPPYGPIVSLPSRATISLSNCFTVFQCLTSLSNYLTAQLATTGPLVVAD